MDPLLIAVATVGLLLLIFVFLYNRLVRLRNAVDNAWAQIEVQLQRRHDLVPNLVRTVAGYAAHERRVLDAVTQARARALAAHGPAERAEAESALSATLMTLFAVAESYPDLRASGNFVQLQQELATTENRIAYSRQYYNDQVLAYTNGHNAFPGNVVARLTGFQPRPYFQAPDDHRDPVEVRF